MIQYLCGFIRALKLPVFAGILLLACQRDPADAAAGRLLELTIVTANDAQHGYQVEVARSIEEQARGLMYRREMAADHGMIFPFSPPRRATFWMANTYLPLDMIFIAPGGTIESIIANAEPLTTTQRSSIGAVSAVLELNAGEAARIGAKAGDKVIYDLQDLQDTPEKGSNAPN